MDRENNASDRLGIMPVNKLVFSISLPVIISMIVQALYNIVDSAFVGSYGDMPLRALSLAFPIQNLFISFAVGFGVGTNALVARYLGQNKKKKASSIANTGIMLSILGYLIFLVLAFFICEPFFSFQTEFREVVDYGVEYLSIVMIGSIAIFIEIILERILMATGRTKLSMVSQATGAVINIILDPLMIFGYGPFPEMGVTGAAIATVIGQIASAIIALILNLVYNKEVTLSIRQVFSFRFKEMGEILKIGVSSIILNAITSIVVLVMNQILIRFSENAITAYGVYFKLVSIVYMPVFGLNAGIVPILSYNYGAKKLDRIKQVYRISIIFVAVVTVVCTVVCQLFPAQLYSIFNATPEVTAIGIPAIRIMSIGFVMAGIDTINSTMFQSIGNPMHSLICILLRQFAILIPLSIVFALTGNLILVWCALPVSEAFALFMSFMFMKTLNRNIRKTIGSGLQNA